jgi:F0F1-type ATP synthase membrane subunit c/vacuolar-type H+-ATPase subunit K
MFMTQPTKGDGSAATLEERLRLMRIIWAMFLFSVGVYAVVGYLAADVGERGAGAPEWVLPLFVVVAVVAVLVSIVVKRAYARRAEAERRPEHAQTGLIIAVALCESAALFGLVGLFVTGDAYSYVLFAVGAVGLLLHFPSRERLAAAYGPGGRVY